MAIGTATATQQGGNLHLEVCPNWTNTACACPKDANGNPEPTAPLAVAHPPYTFGAAVPAGWSLPTAPAEWLALGKTQTQWTALTAAQQWAFQCVVEAIRLVKHDLSASTTTPMTAFVGVTA